MQTSENILKQEQELLKLNEEIDEKTKNLLAQVDYIKKMQSTDEIHSTWGKSQSISEIESKTAFDGTTELCDTNFAFKEYFTKTQNEDSKETNSDTPDNKEIDERKGAVKPDRKTRHCLKSALSLVNTQVKDTGFSLGITRHKSEVRLRTGNGENDVIPETLKGVGHEGIVRFLTAKVKLLTEQVEIMRRDGKKTLEKIKELQTYKDKSVEEKERLTQQANLARNTLIKYEQHTNDIVTQLHTTQAENNHLKKEVEALKKEIRQNNKTQNQNEIKLNRTLEEMEKLKSSLLQIKQEEKETKEFQRRKIEDLTNAVKKLDRQRTELLNGFKKQMVVIDNLKRQKELIEAGKLLKQAEEDFLSFLDCNPPTVGQNDVIKSKS